MERATLTVEGAGGVNYPVHVGPGLLARTLPEFVAAQGASSVAIVTNDVVAPLYGEALQARIPGSFLVSLPDGERHKTLLTVQVIYRALLENGADRATLVVALGGGVIGDMAGFAAATFMRGVRLVQAPTTLLAMVDASIGGKVGVDLPQGKNLVGAFYDPLAVFADTTTLATLPGVEMVCGLAEVVKAALIADPGLLAMLDSDPPDTPALIERAAAVKVRIVGQDRLEAGVRATLNLGHTFAHALEQASGYRWKHGHAVAVGLAAAARLSARLGLCDEGLVAEVERVLARCGLPCRYGGLTPDALWDAMQHDKKWRDGQAHFVLLEDVGRPLIRADVPRQDVLAVLADLQEA